MYEWRLSMLPPFLRWYINFINSNYFKQLIFTRSLITNNKNKSELGGNWIEAAQEKIMNKLNPWFVTGFTDAEGCFLINIRPNSKMKTGYSIELVFKISLHIKDKALVTNLSKFFSVGTVTTRGSDCIQYWVGSLKELQVIVNHFDNYPLISQKCADFLLFKQVVDLMKRKEHLTKEGLNKIVSIKSSLNNGLSEDLMAAFPAILPVIRPQIMSPKIMDPNWVSGFVNGEGCFYLVTKKSLKGGSVGFRLLVTQHIRDAALLKSLVDYLGCGKYYPRPRTTMYGDYLVTSLNDFKNKIIPFFEKYPLQGLKSCDFNDLKKVFLLREDNNGIITPEILEKFEQIKSGMNTGRDFISEEEILQTPKKGSALRSRKVTTGQANKRYYSPGRTIDSNYLKKSDSIINPGVLFKNKEVQTCLLICYLQFQIDYVLLGGILGVALGTLRLLYVGISAIMRLLVSLRINNNFFNSFVLRRKMKIFQQLRSLHNNTNNTPGNKRHYSTAINKGDQTKFNQWLGGLIDGDGQFQTTKKGISSFKIVMHIKDKSLLYTLKHKYGGFIKEIAGSNALKYKLQNPKGLIDLINDVNGSIRNPIRMLQLNRICVKYNIKLKVPEPLTYDSGWFSGLVDSDGSIYIDEKSGQLTISVTQKNIYLLEPLQKIYVGKIDIVRSKGEVFKYSIFKKEEVLNLVDVYFQICPLKSSKALKINLIKDFYLLEPYRNLDVNKIDKFNQWIQFKNKWDKIV